MKKISDAKKTIVQNCTFLRDPPPPYPPRDNVAETHCKSVPNFLFNPRVREFNRNTGDTLGCYKIS